MSVVHLIDTLTEWAKDNICDKVRLKMPPGNEKPDDEGYEYNLVNPAVFPMYVPTEEKLPPNIHSPFPSICISSFPKTALSCTIHTMLTFTIPKAELLLKKQIQKTSSSSTIGKTNTPTILKTANSISIRTGYINPRKARCAR